MRGDEMMLGKSREALHHGVWGSKDGDGAWRGWRDEGIEVRVGEGEGLYIPRGWWHAVEGTKKGEREELSVSVNWWFR